MAERTSQIPLTLLDELSLHGLSSINFLFSTLSKFSENEWFVDENHSGKRIYDILKTSTRYPVSKVDTTSWRNGDEALLDTYYAVEIQLSSARRELDLKNDLKYFLDLHNEIDGTQLYLNGKIEVNKTNKHQVVGWLKTKRISKVKM